MSHAPPGRRAVYGRDAQSPADSSVDDSASSSSASEASFCAVELVDEVHPETLEEVALLKLQNRVCVPVRSRIVVCVVVGEKKFFIKNAFAEYFPKVALWVHSAASLNFFLR